MERRKFVIGLGALAAGSSAAVGTGAFTSAQMNRGGHIDVVNDSDGLIALLPGGGEASDAPPLGEDTDHVFDEGGQLTIDLSSQDGNDGDGVNVNSKYQIGALFDRGDSLPTEAGNSPTTNSAFSIVNQSDSPREIGLDFSFTGDGPDPDGSKLILQARPGTDDTVDDGEATQDLVREVELNGNSQTGTIFYGPGAADGSRDDRLEASGRIGVSILVDTTGSDASSAEDLSGELEVYVSDAALDL